MTTEKSAVSISEQDLLKALAPFWWMPVTRGILLVILGLLIWIAPGSAVLSLIRLLGLYWIIDGVFSIVEGKRSQPERSRLWIVIAGLISIFAGGIMLANPLLSGLIGGTLLVYTIAAFAFTSGVLLIAAGFFGVWSWWGCVQGVLYILFSGLMATHPIATLGALVWLLCIWALVGGAFAIWMGLRLHRLNEASREQENQ